VADGRLCKQCGSAVTADASRFCGYCGSELPTLPDTRPAGPFGDVEARFAALERAGDPGAPEAGRRSADLVRNAMGCRASVGALFIVAALVFLFIAHAILDSFPDESVFDVPREVFTILPLAIAAIGAALAWSGLARRRRFERTPQKRLPVLVLDERTGVRAAPPGDHAHSTHFVILESKGGERREFSISSDMAARVTRGDMGYATVKEEFLLAFHRVDV